MKLRSLVFVAMLASGMLVVAAPPAAAQAACVDIQGDANGFQEGDSFEILDECADEFTADESATYSGPDGSATATASHQHSFVFDPDGHLSSADAVGSVSASVDLAPCRLCGSNVNADSHISFSPGPSGEFEIPEGSTGSVFGSVRAETTGTDPGDTGGGIRASSVLQVKGPVDDEAFVDIVEESPVTQTDSLGVSELPPGRYDVNARLNAEVNHPNADTSNAFGATASFDVTITVESVCDNDFTDGPDIITGTPDFDFLCGGAGNDSIDGLGGNDIIQGGDGSDLIFGGDGLDTLEGGGDDDFIVGGPDQDIITGGGGEDDISGGDHNDDIDGGDGNDIRLYGGPGDDTIDGGLGNDGRHDTFDEVLAGGAGDDKLFGGPGDDIIFGACAQDIVGNVACVPDPVPAPGDADQDTIRGEDGQDVIVGDGDFDLIDGGADKDQIFGGPGPDIIDGGPGDEVNFFDDFPATSGINGGAGNDTILGGTGDDLIDGGDNKDVIIGEQGSDKLRGRDGADCLVGGPRKDVLAGGTGTDRLLARDSVHDVVNGGPQFDRARVDGADRLIAIENDNFQGQC